MFWASKSLRYRNFRVSKVLRDYHHAVFYIAHARRLNTGDSQYFNSQIKVNRNSMKELESG